MAASRFQAAARFEFAVASQSVITGLRRIRARHQASWPSFVRKSGSVLDLGAGIKTEDCGLKNNGLDVKLGLGIRSLNASATRN